MFRDDMVDESNLTSDELKEEYEERSSAETSLDDIEFFESPIEEIYVDNTIEGADFSIPERDDDTVYVTEDSMDELEEDDLPKVTIKLLSPRYDAREALMLLLHTDPSLDIQEIEEVYYPYVRFRNGVRVGSGRFVERLKKIIDCSIDRVSGTAYEAQGIPEYEDVTVYREDMLDIQIPLNECYNKAHDFAMKLYISKGKLMRTPEFQIIEEEEFFKRFYVVNCRDSQYLSYDILVDAMDGGMTILDSELHLNLLEKSSNLLQGENNKLEEGDVVQAEVLEDAEVLESLKDIEISEEIEVLDEEGNVVASEKSFTSISSDEELNIIDIEVDEE